LEESSVIFSTTSLTASPEVVPPLSVFPALILIVLGCSSLFEGAIVSLMLLEVSITSVAFSRVLLLGIGFLLGCCATKAKAEKKSEY